MRKLTKKWQMFLYAIGGMGVNMLNLMVSSYLCSAIIASGFELDVVGNQTFLSRDLVIPAVWAIFGVVAKIIDGVIDVPMASFTDNLKTKFGRRRPALLIGLVPMLIAYVLFTLVTPNPKVATLGNTIFYGITLCVFYSFYTLTMVTYYATFTEIVDRQEDRNFISNVKSVCDIVYFILGYVVVRALLNGLNIRPVAMLVLPIVATMLIPLFLIKENSTKDGVFSRDGSKKTESVNLFKSIAYTFKNKSYILWMIVYAFMTFGIQLFLSGINEYFSVSGMSMILVMMASFAPVPFTLIIYNKLTKKHGFGFSFRYTLVIFAIGMAAMFAVSFLPATPKKFSYNYTVTQADVDAGKIENVVTVSGKDADGAVLTSEAVSVSYVGDPDSSRSDVVKAEAAKDAKLTVTVRSSRTSNLEQELGKDITYTVVVKNVGKTALSDIRVSDSLGKLAAQDAFSLQPQAIAKTILSIITGIISSFGIGAMFSVAYSVPSELAAEEEKRTGVSNAAMYFAVQGLFAGVASGIGGQAVLTWMKTADVVKYMTLVCSIAVLVAFLLSFMLPKSVTMMGKKESK